MGLYRILSNPIYIGQIAHKKVVFAGQQPAIIDQPLWQAVQDQLKTHRHAHQTRSTAADPGLLSGLVFDDQGRRLAPTHTKKGAKRYRYYVAQTLGATDQTDAKAVWWPAQALETVVIDALTRFLIDASRLVSLMGNVPAEETRTRLKQAAALAKTLLASHASGRIEILKRIVSRITVHLGCVDNQNHASQMTAAARATKEAKHSASWS